MSEYIELNTFAKGRVGTLEFTAECTFEVPEDWVFKKAQEELKYSTMESFLDNYLYSDVFEWPKDAEKEGVLAEVKIHNYVTDIGDGRGSIY